MTPILAPRLIFFVIGRTSGSPIVIPETTTDSFAPLASTIMPDGSIKNLKANHHTWRAKIQFGGLTMSDAERFFSEMGFDQAFLNSGLDPGRHLFDPLQDVVYNPGSHTIIDAGPLYTATMLVGVRQGFSLPKTSNPQMDKDSFAWLDYWLRHAVDPTVYGSSAKIEIHD